MLVRLKQLESQLQSLQQFLSETKEQPSIHLPLQIQFELVKNLIPEKIDSLNELNNVINNLKNLQRTNKMFNTALRDDLFLKYLSQLLAEQITYLSIFDDQKYQTWIKTIQGKTESPYIQLLQDVQSAVEPLNQLAKDMFSKNEEAAIQTLQHIKQLMPNFNPNKHVLLTKDGPPQPLLILAIEQNKPKVVKELLVNGAAINNPEYYELHGTGGYLYYSPLITALGRKNLAIIKLLLEFGAPIVDKHDHNALISAVKMRNLDIVKLLLEYGALNALSDHGEAALDVAWHLNDRAIVREIKKWQRKRQNQESEEEN